LKIVLWGAVITVCDAAPPDNHSATAVLTAAHVLQTVQVTGDAIAMPLATSSDPARGRELVMGRESNCMLCHAIPETGAQFMGNIGPTLSGVAQRLSAAQMRLRIVDQSRLNPATVMPAYYRTEGLSLVAPSFQGKPVLNAQQIEDVIAYLQTLK
jgi:sulfur-oxidizing protein SoxX